MPIYEYRCASCGFDKDYLQKLSDAPITDCERCGKPSMTKQISAAGFQLKGSGWYATDFKNNGKKDRPESKAEGESKPDAAKAEAGDKASGDTKPSSEGKTPGEAKPSSETKTSSDAKSSGDSKAVAESGPPAGSGAPPAP
jgi:putative FmdB family regulatory protein